MVMRKIDEIIIHCTATRPNWWEDKTTEEKVAEVKRWHVQDNGWSDLGYHYLIDRDGTVAKGRPVEKAGAHCKGHNSTTIGVSLFGGHGSSERDTFNEHFTVEQNKALRELLADLSDTYGIKKISGHNRYSAKACPGFNVPRWLARKPAAPERTKAVQSKSIGHTGSHGCRRRCGGCSSAGWHCPACRHRRLCAGHSSGPMDHA
jgi:hypothetical protein